MRWPRNTPDFTGYPAHPDGIGGSDWRIEPHPDPPECKQSKQPDPFFAQRASAPNRSGQRCTASMVNCCCNRPGVTLRPASTPCWRRRNLEVRHAPGHPSGRRRAVRPADGSSMTTVTLVRKSAYHNSVPLPALARGLRARTRDRGGRADKTEWRQALRDPLRGPKLNVMRAGDWSAIKDQSRGARRAPRRRARSSPRCRPARAPSRAWPP